MLFDFAISLLFFFFNADDGKRKFPLEMYFSRGLFESNPAGRGFVPGGGGSE